MSLLPPAAPSPANSLSSSSSSSPPPPPPPSSSSSSSSLSSSMYSTAALPSQSEAVSTHEYFLSPNQSASFTSKNAKTKETGFAGFKRGFLLKEKPEKKARYSLPEFSSSSQSSAEVPSQSSIASAASTQIKTKQETTSYCGFKKGFLSGGQTKKTATKQSTVIEDRKEEKSSNAQKPDEKPNTNSKSEQTNHHLCFSEVQAALGATDDELKQKADRVTKIFLEKIEQNTSIKQKLQDPKIIEVIDEFQKNPKAAMEKYHDSPDIQQFFTEFREMLVLDSQCNYQNHCEGADRSCDGNTIHQMFPGSH